MGISLPGVAGIPVMKSLVIKVRITTDLWQEGCFWSGSRSKCKGVKITGIWLIFPAYPRERKLTCRINHHATGKHSVQLNPSRQDLQSHTQTHLFLGLSSRTVFSYSHSTVSKRNHKYKLQSLMNAVICYTYKSIHYSYNYLLYCKHWIRKRWATNPRGNMDLGSCKPLVITYSSTDQYITFLYVFSV